MTTINMKKGPDGVYGAGKISYVTESHTEVCSRTMRVKLKLPRTHEFDLGDDDGKTIATEIEAAIAPVIRKYTKKI